MAWLSCRAWGIGVIAKMQLRQTRRAAHAAGACSTSSHFAQSLCHLAPRLTAQQNKGARLLRTQHAAVTAVENFREAASNQDTQDVASSPIAITEHFPYQRLPCSSPCAPNDTRCLQIEAVFQHVLNYPRLPTRVCTWLPSISKDVHFIARTIEGLSRQYGQELTLLMLRRAPTILEHDIETLTKRADHLRAMLDLRPRDIMQVIRKNPYAITYEPQFAKARYDALHRVLPLSHEGVRQLARKYPLILNYHTKSVEEIVGGLRNACGMRQQWQIDYENITPGLLAYFFRDSTDVMDRLDYLVSTGNSPMITLRDLMKLTGNMFNRKHRDFRAWKAERQLQAQRRQLQLERQQQRLQQEEARIAQLEQEREERKLASRIDGQSQKHRKR